MCCNKGCQICYSVSVNILTCSNLSHSTVEVSQPQRALFLALLMFSYICFKGWNLLMFVFMYHTQISAASPKGKEVGCSKIAPKWGRGPPKKPYFFLPTQPLFWQGWENRVFIHGAVCCGFSTITEWQCLDWEACWRFMEGDIRGPALLSLLQSDV